MYNMFTVFTSLPLKSMQWHSTSHYIMLLYYTLCCSEKEYCVLFVVQQNERNIYDQRPLEFDLWTR